MDCFDPAILAGIKKLWPELRVVELTEYEKLGDRIIALNEERARLIKIWKDMGPLDEIGKIEDREIENEA